MRNSITGDRKVQLRMSMSALKLFFYLLLHKLLFMNSVGVKGARFIYRSSQLASVSKERLFLSTNEHRFEAWSIAVLETELCNM